MGGRNALEENFGLGGIDVLINPSTPSGKSFVESVKTVHVSYQRRPNSNIIPPKFKLNIKKKEEERFNIKLYKG